MSFRVIKDKWGDFSNHTTINQKKYYIFGNAGINFNKQLDDKSTSAETVQDMVIIPPYMLYQDVLAFHLSTNKKEVEYVGKLK